ncbi:MAG: hypothetical protein MUF54_05310 [Polyangiaceae bacterium]|nr:hypothetical protein [Polyangiaceae bacterium]
MGEKGAGASGVVGCRDEGRCAVGLPTVGSAARADRQESVYTRVSLCGGTGSVGAAAERVAQEITSDLTEYH